MKFIFCSLLMASAVFSVEKKQPENFLMAYHLKKMGNNEKLAAKKMTEHREILVQEKDADLKEFLENKCVRGKYIISITQNFKEICEKFSLLSDFINANNIDSTIVLGRTPTIFAHLLQIEKRNCIQVAFSGCPNILPCAEMRKDEYRKNYLKNIFNDKRIEVYFNYLDSLNFEQLENKKVILLDLISTGSGLNAALQLFDFYFKKKNKNPPKITFFAMNDISQQDDKYFTVDSKERTISLKGNPTENRKDFTLPFHSLEIDDKTDILTFLDDEGIATLFAGVPEAPACLWNAAQLQKEAPYKDFGFHILEKLYHGKENMEQTVSSLFQENTKDLAPLREDFLRLDRFKDFPKDPAEFFISYLKKAGII